MFKDLSNKCANKTNVEMQCDPKRYYDDTLGAMKLSKFFYRETYSKHKELREKYIDKIASRYTIDLLTEFYSLLGKLTMQNENNEELPIFRKPKKRNQMLLRSLRKLDMDRLELLSDFFEVSVDKLTNKFDVYKKILANKDHYDQKLHKVLEVHYSKLGRFDFKIGETVKYDIYICVVQEVNKDYITILSPAYGESFVVSRIELNQSNLERLIGKELLSKENLL